MLGSMLGTVVAQSGSMGGSGFLIALGTIALVVWLLSGSSNDEPESHDEEEDGQRRVVRVQRVRVRRRRRRR